MVEEAGWAGTRGAIRKLTGKEPAVAVTATRFASAIGASRMGWHAPSEPEY